LYEYAYHRRFELKRLFIVSVLILFALSIGCSPKQEPKDVPPPPKTPSAKQESAKKIIEDYGTGLAKSMDKARSVQAKEDIREVQRAVQGYAIDHDGAYPPSLNDVKDYLNESVDLNAFNYNPANGAVTLR
jgi:hypothetical protein